MSIHRHCEACGCVLCSDNLGKLCATCISLTVRRSTPEEFAEKIGHCMASLTARVAKLEARPIVGVDMASKPDETVIRVNMSPEMHDLLWRVAECAREVATRRSSGDMDMWGLYGALDKLERTRREKP